MRKLHMVLSTALFLSLNACSTTKTTVLNNTDGTTSIEASDRTEADALDGGISKANDLCNKGSKSAIILSRQVRYTGGMDPNTKGILNTVASTAEAATGTFINKQDTSQDYTVTIKFKCE